MINKGLIVLIGTFFLVGCGSSGTTTVETGIGYYEDSAVSGVKYICGSKEGSTGVDGSFTFEKGKDCTFSINTIKLREVASNKLSDGVKIKEDNLDVARFLQSLDIDGDPENGINVSSDVISALKSNNITALPTGTDIASIVDILKSVEGYNGSAKSKEETALHLAGFLPKIIVSKSIISNDEAVILEANITGNKEGLTYAWKEGNSILGTDQQLNKDDFSKGKHTIVLSVTNNDGDTLNDSVTITVVDYIPMEVTISSNGKANIADDEEITFTGTIENPGDNLTYTWIDTFTDVNATTPSLGNKGINNYGPPVQMDDKNITIGDNNSEIVVTLPEGRHNIMLKVTDDQGREAFSNSAGIWVNFKADALTENKDYVLIDTKNNKMWVNDFKEDGACLAVHDNDFNKSFCDNLVFAGFDNWRPPLTAEIQDFVIRTYVGNIRPDTTNGKPCPYMLGLDENGSYISVTSRHYKGKIPGTVEPLTFSAGLRCVRDNN